MIVQKDQGMWWPESDVHCMAAMRESLTDIQHIIPFVKNFDTCIQAGGNVGIWPLEFSKYFKNVYTFEPDPENFDCLDLNTKGVNNIYAYNSALGEKLGMCSVSRSADNCGAGYINFSGPVPINSVDHLELDNIGLIQLDIEGHELPALKGAEGTIRRFSPVIVIEEKGLSERYGIKSGDTQKYLEGLGYTLKKEVNRDLIFTKEA